jgi:DNA-binding MarR family transcriptional regulator
MKREEISKDSIKYLLLLMKKNKQRIMFNLEINEENRKAFNALLNNGLLKAVYVTKDKKQLEDYHYHNAMSDEDTSIDLDNDSELKHRMYCYTYSIDNLKTIFESKEVYEKHIFEEVFYGEPIKQITASCFLSNLAQSAITPKELKLAAHLACSKNYAQMSDNFFIINQNELLEDYNYTNYYEPTELKQSHISRFLKSLIEKDILEKRDNNYRFKIFEDLV